jgi:hypothetical protein
MKVLGWNKKPHRRKTNAIQPKTSDDAFVKPQYIDMDEKKCIPVVQNRESVKVIPSKVGRGSIRAKDWKKNPPITKWEIFNYLIKY